MQTALVQIAPSIYTSKKFTVTAGRDDELKVAIFECDTMADAEALEKVLRSSGIKLRTVVDVRA